MLPRAVIFDLDGVLVDSEHLWDRIRRDVVAEHGGEWSEGTTETLMGMSTPEWARHLVDRLGVRLTPEQTAETVIERMAQHYAAGPPVIPHATDAVRTVARDHPTAIASSAPPRIIRRYLEATDLTGTIGHTVSSEEVGAGKPAPDVYLRAAQGLDIDPRECVAVEDSGNGLRAAAASGATVIAVPNPHFPPDPEALRQIHHVIDEISELPPLIRRLTSS
ncbi:HAD superfamily hydrolase (TIGR01509 family) [Saccharopolyspora lacisalsi]|uniref:HAD superfamily hydrolase (TIGR01509 family) n=1 Tax=Halosaccharopolyspora lacisalsi TaxID=1000566 RepID=A0A839E367_9PSEU|nr:HAD family phosphatase [Halosaccharopolyspora lacisalsi]MBA8827309.1 HAD superfamily hydrolase (TIGR01509 family) [Halosaccharopolyspora lacisalsi]